MYLLDNILHREIYIHNNFVKNFLSVSNVYSIYNFYKIIHLQYN